ncbi:hypothetical protein L1987_16568 [Smallanthus sonchifolius]|uniref:Uncharacterized protein n=1 Tax=Smallanthus sonchifolius TaxID=185202 RepID=A0ACB9IXY1_9ASTR|nr:hypothetical protein L1987_16568 [Smallanthus sonchifolius]
MVECLAKWVGSHKLNDHEAWRKETGQRRALPNWLDVERGKCNPGETMQRDKKKKRKHKGRNPFKNQNTGLQGKDGHDTRRKIKVHSSKKQNFLKSLSQEAVIFSNSGNIPKVIPPPLGFGEFRIGKASPGNIENGSKPKLKKFSAHVNAQGMVTIDEDMVDNTHETEETNQVHIPAPKSSYAQKLTVTNNMGHRRNVPGTQPGNRNRQNGTGIINTYERNIVSNQNGVNAQAGKGKEGEGEKQEGLSNASNYTTQKEGMENTEPHVPQQEERNAGWIKKQERILNKDYSSQVNQEERFEAKREVESETDATAMMMSPDGPTPLTAEGHTIITENSEATAQPPVAMKRGGLKGNYPNTFCAWGMEQACNGLQREMGRGMGYYGRLRDRVGKNEFAPKSFRSVRQSEEQKCYLTNSWDRSLVTLDLEYCGPRRQAGTGIKEPKVCSGLHADLVFGLRLDGVGSRMHGFGSCGFESRELIEPRMVGDGWDGAMLGFTCSWSFHAWGCLNLGLI